MQMTFGFLSADLARWHAKLAVIRDHLEQLPARRPLAQLVKSMISGRTHDAVSQGAFDGLRAAFGGASRLADAEPADVARVIADVTFAEDKAKYVVAALRHLRASRYGFDLDCLGKQPLATSLAFLETLPGVARKVSASTLNASTLQMPVMIIDTHVLRVLSRLGVIPFNASNRLASEAVSGAMPHWRGPDFLDFHVELKWLGQVICRWDVPRCETCPLADDCQMARGRGRALFVNR